VMENVHQFPPPIDRIAQGDDCIDDKRVKKKHLVNRLNALNFIDGTLLVNLKHVKYNHTVVCKARPLPCIGDELVCEWMNSANLYPDLSAYRFLNILVPDGPKLILVESESGYMNEEGLQIRLPETCSVVNRRRSQRYSCKNIQARLIQNSAIFDGVLLEFCPNSFYIEIHPAPPQTFKWIDPNLSATIIFLDEKHTYYSGICKILKQSEGTKTRSYVLEPLENQTRRFKPREFRSTRQELLPLPNIIFQHPLIKIAVNLKAMDLSGTGFAVEEDRDNSVLLPGMIIPDVQINFACCFKVDCKVQVVYRKTPAAEEKKQGLKYGLAILDMDIDEHRKLTSILYQATDSRSYLSTQVDMEALWEFFFESGLIYPQKYNFLLENKDHIKKTYENLYNSNSSIARHFIYQDKGRILGHMSMLRLYKNSWLIQHHSAGHHGSVRAGLAVLNQVDRFINDSHRIYSAHMDFVFCYYRPENKFPDRIFGGICRHINDPKICSLDNFAYFHYRKTDDKRVDEEDGWTLTEMLPEDFGELKSFYKYSSGGLMLSGLDLEAGMTTEDDVTKEFERHGFRKGRHLFSLKKNNIIKAIIIENISDVGLNLSDLTNCIQAIIFDSDSLPRAIFFKMLSQISLKFKEKDVPVLIYPVSYAENQSISFEKIYSLWVYDLQHIDYYLSYLKRLIRQIQH